jgi:hypothetical protein
MPYDEFGVGLIVCTLGKVLDLVIYRRLDQI